MTTPSDTQAEPTSGRPRRECLPPAAERPRPAARPGSERRVDRAAGQGHAHRLHGQAAARRGAAGPARRGGPGPAARDLRAVGARARRAGCPPDLVAELDRMTMPFGADGPERGGAARRPGPAGRLARGPVPRHPGHPGGPADGGPGPARRDPPADACRRGPTRRRSVRAPISETGGSLKGRFSETAGRSASAGEGRPAVPRVETAGRAEVDLRAVGVLGGHPGCCGLQWQPADRVA